MMHLYPGSLYTIVGVEIVLILVVMDDALVRLPFLML